MPRYRKKSSYKYKPLRTPGQFAFFLGSLSDDQFEQFKTHDVSHPKVHPQAYADIKQANKLQLIHALTHEHKASLRGQHVGGSLGDALNSIGSALFNVGIKPFQIPWNLASNLVAPLTHGTSVSSRTHLMAQAIQESYKSDVETRADYIDNLIRDPALSSEYTDVWVNRGDTTDHILMSVRGTASSSDVGHDVSLALTGRTQNLIGTNINQAIQKYPDAKVEIGGHSLGTQLISEAFVRDPTLKNKVDRVDFFNPSSSPLIETSVQKFSSDPKFYYYENQADLVGWGQQIWSEPPRNLTMKTIRSMNPAENHSLDQWLAETPFESGQLTSDQTTSILSGETQWAQDALTTEE
jgi:hypothetical protein